MSDDLRVKFGFFEHPKTEKLERRLGADGVLCFMRLWKFCGMTAGRKQGSLDGLDDEEIAIAARWRGEPATLIAALRGVRFLDGKPGHYQVHDFAEHQPFVAGSTERSDTASANAFRRWHAEGKHDEAPVDGCPDCQPDPSNSNDLCQAMPPACDPHAKAMLLPPDQIDRSALTRGDGEVETTAEVDAIASEHARLPPMPKSYRKEIQGLLPIPRDRVLRAAKAAAGADVPNWKYLALALRPGKAGRSRAGPGIRKKPAEDPPESERFASDGAGEARRIADQLAKGMGMSP